MLKTCFGDINVTINGCPIQGEVNSFAASDKTFVVDARYGIRVDNEMLYIGKPIVIEILLFCLYQDQLEKEVESGEELAAISFIKDSIKLSIGVIGDQQKYVYEYTENGIKLFIYTDIKPGDILFLIAWKKMKNQYLEYNDTWFAVDPSNI